MDRKLISHRIGSILDDISRLSNALYALDTTDIQRYPDNYETLSIDAALRAEPVQPSAKVTISNPPVQRTASLSTARTGCWR